MWTVGPGATKSLPPNHWFSSISFDFHWFSLILIDWHRYSSIFHRFSNTFIDFPLTCHWFPLIFPSFSSIFADFQCFALVPADFTPCPLIFVEFASLSSLLQSPNTSKPLKKLMNFQWFCFSEQHWSILVSIDRHWSTLASIIHHWFTLINLGQHSSTPTSNNTDRYWSPVINIEQHWPTLINTGQHWWTLINTVNIDQHWSTLSNTDQHWSTMTIIDEHWLNVPSYPTPSHPLSYVCIKGPAIPTQASESCGTSRPSYPLGIWPCVRSSTLPQSHSS